MLWKSITPKGTIISFARLSKEDWDKMDDNNKIIEGEDTYPLFDDTDPDVNKLVTTEGEYMVIAQKSNGHGQLLIVQPCTV